MTIKIIIFKKLAYFWIEKVNDWTNSENFIYEQNSIWFMLNPQQKRIALSSYFFFNEFLEGRRDRASFMELFEQFNSNFISDGFSQREIDEIKDRVKRLVLINQAQVPIEKIIPLTNASPSGHNIRQYAQDFLYEPWRKNVDTFIRQAREFLYNSINDGIHASRSSRREFLSNPQTAYLEADDLTFLVQSLGLNKTAFLYKHESEGEFIGRHYMLITNVEITSPSASLGGRILQLIKNRGFTGGSTSVYDPMKNYISSLSTDGLIGRERSFYISRGSEETSRSILSKDLFSDYEGRRDSKKTDRFSFYTPLEYLAEIDYRLNENFVKRIGRVQHNAYDCGPSVVYAALQSKY